MVFFQTITVSECCLIKLLSCILFKKYINILALEMGHFALSTSRAITRYTSLPAVTFAASVILMHYLLFIL